ncbi:MAG: PDC sensor domain-containing protein [Gammaproteobacteria bacterium]|nr:PDC sensor domain-containing protein [Gammaproteobacteria bacterium]
MGQVLKDTVARQRILLRGLLSSPMERLAYQCRDVWPNRVELEQQLIEGLHTLPTCKFLFVLDGKAQQITDNICLTGPVPDYFGRDRSGRPYLRESLAGETFALSDAYLSRNTRRPTLTAIQQITNEHGNQLGFLGADFDLRELPLTREVYKQPDQWMQMKGDPAIRGGLFNQQRVESPMDKRIDEVFDLLLNLIDEHGVFHGKLHFSSSRATLWFIDDPLRYRILDIEDLTDPGIVLTYPNHAYPEDAEIPLNEIKAVFQTFRNLRFMDETIYLRAGSLNIYNGMVGLNFSCDGSHYMPWGQLLDKNLDFWLGTGNL